jgi:hypothetical protein
VCVAALLLLAVAPVWHCHSSLWPILLLLLLLAVAAAAAHSAPRRAAAARCGQALHDNHDVLCCDHVSKSRVLHPPPCVCAHGSPQRSRGSGRLSNPGGAPAAWAFLYSQQPTAAPSWRCCSLWPVAAAPQHTTASSSSATTGTASSSSATTHHSEPLLLPQFQLQRSSSSCVGATALRVEGLAAVWGSL